MRRSFVGPRLDPPEPPAPFDCDDCSFIGTAADLTDGETREFDDGAVEVEVCCPECGTRQFWGLAREPDLEDDT